MSRANRVLAIALGVIVVLAVIGAVVSSGRARPQFAAGTPEATVQSYLDAVLDGRQADAAKLLDPSGECGVEDLERSRYPGVDATRVVLVGSSVDGSSASVEVELVFSSGDPFGSSEFAEKHTYRLTRSGSAWVLSGTPWPLYECWKE